MKPDDNMHRKTTGIRMNLQQNIIGLILVITAGLTGCSSDSLNAIAPPALADTPTTSTPSDSTALPPMKHFRIGDSYSPIQDCHVDGADVTCEIWDEPTPSVELYTGSVTGTLSGATLTGTSTIHQRYHDEADPHCIIDQDTSGPITYVFSLDGTVLMRGGPTDEYLNRSGSCPGRESATGGLWESSGKWSVIE